MFVFFCTSGYVVKGSVCGWRVVKMKAGLSGVFSALWTVTFSSDIYQSRAGVANIMIVFCCALRKYWPSPIPRIWRTSVYLLFWPNVMIEWFTLMLCILDAPWLKSRSDYRLSWRFLWFSSVQANAGKYIHIMPWPFANLSSSLLIYHPFIWCCMVWVTENTLW
jgi:hypothetical protein